MSNSVNIDAITSRFPGKVEKLELQPAQAAVLVDKSIIRDFMKFLREDKELAFDYLYCLSAVDWEEYLEVVYHINSTAKHHKLVVKVKLPTENPVIDTISDIYRAADWYEREIWELFGIDVRNHPDLRQLLLPDNWDEGPPMRRGWTGSDFVIMPEP